MAEQPKRRSILKRIAGWTTTAVLFLAVYVGTVPVVYNIVVSTTTNSLAIAVMQAVYAPLDIYCSLDLPGSNFYRRYSNWCIWKLRNG